MKTDSHSVLSIASFGKGKRTEAVVGFVERRPSLPAGPAGPAATTSQSYEDDYRIKTDGYVWSAVDRDYIVCDDEHLRHSFHDHAQGVFLVLRIDRLTRETA